MTTYRNVNKLELAAYLADQLHQDKGLIVTLLNEYLAQKPKRSRKLPHDDIRCMGRVWREGDAHQCMSKRSDGEFCSRHAKQPTEPCKHCSKGGDLVVHEFAWQHHGRFDELVAPEHFLSVQSKSAIPLDSPFVCECGQEIAFQRTHCPSCDVTLS